MPPKSNGNDTDVIAAVRLSVHQKYFDKAHQAARTLHEVMDLRDVGTPLSSYTDACTTNNELVLTTEHKDKLNKNPRMLIASGETYESAASQLQFQQLTTEIKSWQQVITILGEPLATDDPESWDLHDLVLLHSLAVSVIAMVKQRIANYSGD